MCAVEKLKTKNVTGREAGQVDSSYKYCCCINDGESN